MQAGRHQAGLPAAESQPVLTCFARTSAVRARHARSMQLLCTSKKQPSPHLQHLAVGLHVQPRQALQAEQHAGVGVPLHGQCLLQHVLQSQVLQARRGTPYPTTTTAAEQNSTSQRDASRLLWGRRHADCSGSATPQTNCPA